MLAELRATKPEAEIAQILDLSEFQAFCSPRSSSFRINKIYDLNTAIDWNDDMNCLYNPQLPEGWYGATNFRY